MHMEALFLFLTPFIKNQPESGYIISLLILRFLHINNFRFLKKYSILKQFPEFTLFSDSNTL